MAQQGSRESSRDRGKSEGFSCWPLSRDSNGRSESRHDGFVRVRGAREHNLKNVDVEHPARRAGRLHRRLRLGQVVARVRHALRRGAAALPRIGLALRAAAVPPDGVPEVDEIDGLPPAVALQQQRGTPTTRSSVGSVTTLSNLLRMLYSRAGDYPPGQAILYAESFSPNTPEGACPRCHGLGRVYDVTEQSMVPDRLADHPRARHRRLAAGVARAEPARHPHHARHRRRHAVARAAEEGPRLDPVHRRAAARCRSTPATTPTEVQARAQAQGGAELHGHLHRRAAVRAAHVRQHAERADEEARRAVHGQRRLPAVPRQAAAAAKRCR